MASAQKVVLLACGSFNPPTNMHLRMFELGRDYLQRNGKYNVIAGIMSPVSDGYNKKDLAPAKQRCAMVQLALKSSKWVRLDTWESELPCWSETEKVLQHHNTILCNQINASVRATPSKKRKKDKRNEDVITERNVENSSPRHSNKDEVESVQLKLLCGGDLLESFAVPGLWKDEDIEEIVGKYGLVCITRNGSDPRKFIYESDVLTKHQDNIHIVTEWIQNEVSSTKIRRALRRSESVKYLLQDCVIDYIRENGLYGVSCDKNSPVEGRKYSEISTPSPISDIMDIMDYVDGGPPNGFIPVPAVGNVARALVPTRSPIRLTDKDDGSSENPGSPRRPGIGRSQSPRIVTTTPSGSPKRFMETELDEDMSSSNSPKSPQPGPCLAPDLGTLVRRVRNYNLQGIFHPKKIQPK